MCSKCFYSKLLNIIFNELKYFSIVYAMYDYYFTCSQQKCKTVVQIALGGGGGGIRQSIGFT